MGRDNDALRQKVSPLLHRRRQRLFHLIANMPTLSITTDQNFQLYLRQTLKQRGMPRCRASFHRWNITARLVISRKTKPHRHHRNLRRVVENLFVDLQPVSQSIARGIREWSSRLHCQISRRLPRNQDFRRRGNLQDRLWRLLHVGCA